MLTHSGFPNQRKHDQTVWIEIRRAQPSTAGFTIDFLSLTPRCTQLLHVGRVIPQCKIHVSVSPRFIPDSRISRVRLATLAFPNVPSHYHRSLNADSYTPLAIMVYPSARHITAVTSFNRLRVRSCAALVPAKRREPLCPQQVLPLVA